MALKKMFVHLETTDFTQDVLVIDDIPDEIKYDLQDLSLYQPIISAALQ